MPQKASGIYPFLRPSTPLTALPRLLLPLPLPRFQSYPRFPRWVQHFVTHCFLSIPPRFPPPCSYRSYIVCFLFPTPPSGKSAAICIKMSKCHFKTTKNPLGVDRRGFQDIFFLIQNLGGTSPFSRDRFQVPSGID